MEFRILWRSCGVPFDIDIGLDIDHDIGRCFFKSSVFNIEKKNNPAINKFNIIENFLRY